MQKILNSENTIYIDDRENNIIASLLKKEGFDIIKKRILVADFVLGKDTAVERKTARDFARSIVDKRLFKQLREMKESYHNSLVVVEGEIDEMYGENIHPNAIRGALLSVVFDYGVPVFFSRGLEETAEILVVLKKRLSKKKKEISIRKSRKAMGLYEKQLWFLEGLPNIGRTIAKNILDEFRTIKKFVNANEREMLNVKKLGKKKIKEIREILEKKSKKK